MLICFIENIMVFFFLSLKRRSHFLNLSHLSETDLVAVVEDLSTKCSGDTCSAITTDFLALVTNHDAHSEK